MRVTALGMRSEVLPVDFQPPPGVRERQKIALHINRDPTSTAVAMKFLRKGQRSFTGVWDSASGKLVWPTEGAGDIAWSPDGTQVFVVMSKFGPGPKGQGIGHRLLRYSWPGLGSRKGPELLEELVFSVPSGGPDRLAIAPAGNFGVVVAKEQGDWYYEVLRLQPKLSQPFIGHHVRLWSGDPPAFSPDERFVVAAGWNPGKWWALDAVDWEEEDEPVSPGGIFTLGFIYAQDLKTKRVTERPLQVKLPAGWQPKKGTNNSGCDAWTFVWGPKFLAARSFRLWLPDGSPLDLNLPLPKTVRASGLRSSW